jgi:putative aldouronate transport system substrate-binding protein
LRRKVRFFRSCFLVLTTVSLAVVSAACTSEGTSGSTAGSVSTPNQTDVKRDPVTLKVEVFDRGNSPAGLTVTDNHQTKYIQEAFGNPRNITVKFVPVPRAEENQKLNVLMATSDVPDIVFTYDINTAYKYVQQGGLAELTEPLDKYGPNLKKFLGDTALDYGKFDGGLYSIVAKREFLGRWGQFIRKDWLDQLKIPVPTNKDELYAALKEFKKQDPGKTGGKTIPYGFSMGSASFFSMLWSYIQPESEEQKFVYTQQYSSMDNPVLLPGHKEGVRWLNQLFNEGLLSPDFGLDKDGKQLKQAVMNGGVGFFSEAISTPFAKSHQVALTLKQNVPSAELIPIDTFKSKDGKYPKPLYEPGGMYIMIPKASKRVKEAIEYLDWQSNLDNYNQLRFGKEGRNYKLVNGFPVTIDEELNKVELYNGGDYKLLTTGTFWGSVEKNIQSVGIGQEPFNQPYMDTLKMSLVDGFHFINLPHPLKSQADYGETLKQKYDQLIVKAIMAKPGSFDAEYDNALKDYMNSGGNAVVEERKALWKK